MIMALHVNSLCLTDTHKPLIFIKKFSNLDLGFSENASVERLCKILRTSQISSETFIELCQSPLNLGCLDTVSSTGSSLLGYAASFGKTAIVKKIVGLSGTKFLNVGNRTNSTPVTMAIIGKHYFTVLQLLALGAEVNALCPVFGSSSDKLSYSYLTTAASIENNIAITILLLRHGARVDWFEVESNKNRYVYKNIHFAKEKIIRKREKIFLLGKYDPNSILSRLPREFFYNIVTSSIWVNHKKNMTSDTSPLS